jgi:hypothetical protein
MGLIGCLLTIINNHLLLAVHKRSLLDCVDEQYDCCANFFVARALSQRLSSLTNCDLTERRFASLASRDCTSKDCVRAENYDASERCKASNQRNLLNASFLFMPAINSLLPLARLDAFSRTAHSRCGCSLNIACASDAATDAGTVAHQSEEFLPPNTCPHPVGMPSPNRPHAPLIGRFNNTARFVVLILALLGRI